MLDRFDDIINNSDVKKAPEPKAALPIGMPKKPLPRKANKESLGRTVSVKELANHFTSDGINQALIQKISSGGARYDSRIARITRMSGDMELSQEDKEYAIQYIGRK